MNALSNNTNHSNSNSNNLYNKAYNTLKQIPIKHNENTHDISINKDDDDDDNELNCDYVECIPNEIHIVSHNNINNINNANNENVNNNENNNVHNGSNSNNISQTHLHTQPKPTSIPKKKNKKSKSHLFSKLSYPTSQQHSTHIKKHIHFINTNPSSSPTTNASPTNKYEQYNTEAIAYKAYNRYSKCKPTSSNFLDRMKFYSIKKQTQSDAIDIIVDKAKRKIRETDRILTFNRLIEDSNRRAEAKNRVEIFHNDKRLAEEMFDKNNNFIKEPKKKFNKKHFEQRYNSVLLHVKEREKSLEYLRKEKQKENERKEKSEIDIINQYTRKASQSKIKSIANRLYNDGKCKRRNNTTNDSKFNDSCNSGAIIKKDKSSSQLSEKKFKKFSFANDTGDNGDNSNSNKKKKYVNMKLRKSKKRESFNYDSGDDNINNNNNSCNFICESCGWNNNNNNNHLGESKRSNYNYNSNNNNSRKQYAYNYNKNYNKKFITYYNAEKIIDLFFTKSKHK